MFIHSSLIFNEYHAMLYISHLPSVKGVLEPPQGGFLLLL